jgi:hypothetical protein
MIAAPWLLAAVMAQAGVPAQTLDVRPGAIHGRVSRPDGRPAVRAEVRLLPNVPFRGNRVSVTDQDGAYAFDNLPPGFYRLLAQKSGFIPTQYGGRPIDDPGEPVLVTAGELRERIDIVLARQAAITGRVVDENGDPVEGARVHAQQLRYVGGRYRLVDAFGVHERLTDDRGQFRIYGLQAGSYLVSAVVGQIDYPANAMVNLPGYAPTFYPGRVRVSDAESVKVPAGQDAALTDFALARVRTARVSGTAVNSHGEPITGGLVIRPTVRSGGVGEEFGARIERDGRFEFRNVPPGEYVIVASKSRQRPSVEGEFASRVVNVDGEDVEGLSVRTNPGSTVSGHVVLEGGSAPPDAFTIEPYPVDADFDPPPGGAIAHAELTPAFDFTMSGISGPRRFRLTEAPDGWMLKSVRVNGQDVTDDVLSFGTSADSLSDVDIVLSRMGGEVSGTLAVPRGVSPSLYSVIVFSDNANDWYAESRFLRSAAVSSDGSFDVRGLPAGTYFVAAIPGGGGDGWQEPRWLEALSAAVPRHLVGEGQNLSLMLKPASMPRR